MVEDTKVHLAPLNEELQEMNWQVDMVKVAKAKQQWEWQWLEDEQAEKDQLQLLWSNPKGMGRSSWLNWHG